MRPREGVTTLEESTEPMLQEVVSASLYEPEDFPDQRYPRVQILTIEELLTGEARAQYPCLAPEATFRRAKRQRRSEGSQSEPI